MCAKTHVPLSATAVMIALALLFVACEGERGPTGPQGAAGEPGTPRRMYIHRSFVTGTGSGPATWSYTTDLPWVPATDGVIANLRGYECVSDGWVSTTDVGCRISSITVMGTSVTIGGWVYIVDVDFTPYTYLISFDILAFDTLTTVKFEEMIPPSMESIVNRGSK